MSIYPTYAVHDLVISGLFYVLGTFNCSITSLNVSNNPLGLGIHSPVSVPGQSGLGSLGATEEDGSLNLRTLLGNSRTLCNLDLSNTQIPPAQLLTAFGGPNGSLSGDMDCASMSTVFPDGTSPLSLYPLTELNMEGLRLDEPCCMQLAYALPHMKVTFTDTTTTTTPTTTTAFPLITPCHCCLYYMHAYLLTDPHTGTQEIDSER